eukprot:COSAG03_NODE_15714_length_422_cov_1.445820_2_plen_71_part_00
MYISIDIILHTNSTFKIPYANDCNAYDYNACCGRRRHGWSVCPQVLPSVVKKCEETHDAVQLVFWPVHAV